MHCGQNKGNMISNKEKVIFTAGVLLSLSEIIKQILLYFVVNNGHYDWWYFPFQLCSLPMYFCLLVPFLKKKKAILCFLMDISLLSGIFAFFDTSGMHYPILILTIHSVCWHLVMIAVGIYTGINYRKSLKRRDYIGVINIFIVVVFIAEMINYMVSKRHVINLFYVNPYLKMNQVIFADIGGKFGNNIGIIIYLLAILAGGYIIHYIWMLLGNNKSINKSRM